MDKGKIIDLDKELSDLFRHEQLLGFFEFECRPAWREPLSGICKVSRLREGEAESRYFSLLFILDTPGEGDWAAADTILSPIEWERLRESLSGVTKVVAIPYSTFNKQYYLKELYFYVGPHADYQRPYVARVLFPALRALTGFELSAPVFMEDVPSKKPAGETSNSSPALAESSIIDRIKAFLK
jgi:hypothetical protein